MTVLLLAQTAPCLAAGTYIQDPQGCNIWNPRPQRGESITWSGTCVAGYGEGPGTVTWFDDSGQAKDRVETALVHGKSEGKGIAVDADGARIETMWHEGEPVGPMSIAYKNGAHAEITLATDGGKDHAVMTYSSGDRYVGESADGKRNGNGVYTWLNGDRYEGGYADGKKSGHGILILKNGRRLEADFKDEMATGDGVETFPDGSRYEGGFKNDTFFGHGVYIAADGSRYAGEFTDGASAPADRPPIVAKSDHGTVPLPYGFAAWARSASSAIWAEYWKSGGKGTSVPTDPGYLETRSDESGNVGAWRLAESSGVPSLEANYLAAANRISLAASPLHNQTLVMAFALNPEKLQSTRVTETDFQGALKRRELGTSPLPPNAKYADLSALQKNAIKAQYEPMADADEPPFPAHGVGPEIKAISRAEQAIHAEGVMRMLVEVNANGDATGVKVIQSPGPEITKAVAGILILQQYKPALCSGTPCKMDYLFETTFHLE